MPGPPQPADPFAAYATGAPPAPPIQPVASHAQADPFAQYATSGPPIPPMASHTPGTPPKPPRKGLGQMILEQRDKERAQYPPLDPSTRELIAGGVGAAVAPEIEGAAAMRGVAGVAARALPSIVGAATGGGLEGGTEGAGRQAAYEAGGQLVTWPLRAIGKRVAASSIGKAALEKLSTGLQTAKDTVGALKTQGLGGAVARPESTAVGRQVESVAQGPARRSLDAIGQAVDEAAKTGPEVDWTPVKQRISQLAESIQPVASHDVVTNMGGSSTFTPQQMKAFGGIKLEPDHPIPGVLQALHDAPDTIPFEQAHQFKRQLDEAVNWSRPAKKQVDQITKATRQEVRNVLSVHEPYNQATAAYAQTRPLFESGYVRQLHQAAITNPESIVSMIKGSEPTKLQMLHDVLTTHAEAGGGADQGQAAWDAVRSAWTHKNLVSPGVENFDKSLAKVDPKFLSIMYGDTDGKTVLNNLKSISGAFKDAVGRETQATGDLAAFRQSSLAKPHTAEQAVSDVAHIALMPHSVFSLRSMGRLATTGPSMADLVHYSSMSPKWTGMLVAALKSPTPAKGMADLARYLNLPSPIPEPVASHDQGGPPVPPGR